MRRPRPDGVQERERVEAVGGGPRVVEGVEPDLHTEDIGRGRAKFRVAGDDGLPTQTALEAGEWVAPEPTAPSERVLEVQVVFVAVGEHAVNDDAPEAEARCRGVHLSLDDRFVVAVELVLDGAYGDEPRHSVACGQRVRKPAFETQEVTRRAGGGTRRIRPQQDLGTQSIVFLQRERFEIDGAVVALEVRAELHERAQSCVVHGEPLVDELLFGGRVGSRTMPVPRETSVRLGAERRRRIYRAGRTSGPPRRHRRNVRACTRWGARRLRA